MARTFTEMDLNWLAVFLGSSVSVPDPSSTVRSCGKRAREEGGEPREGGDEHEFVEAALGLVGLTSGHGEFAPLDVVLHRHQLLEL